MTPCILTDWLINKGGYGQKGHKYAHRVAYEKAHGPIPKGLVVRHKCDVTACINPDHLEVGTHKQNTHDAIERGRFVNPPVHKGAANPKAVLTVEQVVEIYQSTDSHVACGRRYGVTPEAIGMIRRRQTWREATQDLAMRE